MFVVRADGLGFALLWFCIFVCCIVIAGVSWVCFSFVIWDVVPVVCVVVVACFVLLLFAWLFAVAVAWFSLWLC